MIQILSFRSTDKEHFAMALAIRNEVFVVEQDVDPVLENDCEEESHHYLLIKNKMPVATARWRETTKGIKLERFAVLKDHRNKTLGAEILQEVLKDVIPLGKPVYLHSQAAAVRFYERNGFAREGEMFEEAGIEHYLMWYHKCL